MTGRKNEAKAAALKDLAVKTASDVISAGDSSGSKVLNTDVINHILESLQMVQEHGGVLEKIKEFQNFRDEMTKQLASNDLAVMMAAPANVKLDIARIKQALHSSAGALPPEVVASMDDFVRKHIEELLLQASEMNPNTEDLKRRVALVKELVSRRSKEPSSLFKGTSKLVQAWAELAAAGATLIQGNQELKKAALAKFAKAERDPQSDEWLLQSGVRVMQQVVAARARLKKAIALVKNAAEHTKTMLAEDEFENGEGLESLLNLEVPNAIISELSVECMDDLVSRAAAIHTESLKKELDNFYKKAGELYVTKGGYDTDDYFKSLSQDGDNYWADGLGVDCGKSLAEVYQIGQTTILTWLPGRAMKAYAAYIEQVEETMQLFLQQFMDETVSDGAVEAMSQFQSTWCKCLDTGKQAKVHLTEVFLLKGAKMCVDGKASDNITAITEGKQLLSTKLGVLKSKGLEVSEHLFCPWLVKEARKLLEDTPAAAAGLDTL